MIKVLALVTLAFPVTTMASSLHCDESSSSAAEQLANCAEERKTMPSAFVQRALQTRVGTLRTSLTGRHIGHLCQEANGSREAVARHLALTLPADSEHSGKLDAAVERKVQQKMHCPA